MNYTIVGIDFGTSTTVVKAKSYGPGTNPKDCVPVTFNGNSYLPTLIFEDKGGKLFFGYDAEAQISGGTEGVTHKNFKMELIGNSEQQAKAKRLIKAFFSYIYSEFNNNRQRLSVYPTVKTYVSYPAKWTPEIRNLMKQCAIEAGFGTEKDVFGESEPTAAIYASITANLDKLQEKRIIVRNQPVNVMMLDMGAGTSDIAIFKFKIDDSNKPVINELITYPTIDNDSLCGGREIDDLLAKDLEQYVVKLSKNEPSPPRLIKAINAAVKKWKEQNLAPDLEASNSVKTPPGNVNEMIEERQEYGLFNIIPFEPIDRIRFESLTRPHWQELRSLIEGAVNEAKAGKNKLSNFNGAEDIDLVILTGGHSKWYGVREFILNKDFAGLAPIDFSKIKKESERLLQEAHPQETVSNGLVYKDIPFDVKHTMGNSLWVQFEIDGKKSQLFNPVLQHEVLPVKDKPCDWEIQIKSHSLTSKEVEIVCNCYYGSSKEKSIVKEERRTLPINDAFCAAVGAPFRLIGGVFNEICNAFEGKKSFGDGLEDSFKETYAVKISTIINVEKDGTGKITGTLGSDWNSGEPFEITL